MKRVALVIGINQYADRQIVPLKYAANDATKIGQMLVKSGQFDEVETVTGDNNPNPPGTMEKAQELLGMLGSGDLFFFFFAGHAQEVPGKGPLLLFPGVNSGHLTKGVWDGSLEVKALLKLDVAAGVGLLLVVDACRSPLMVGRAVQDAAFSGEQGLRDVVKGRTAKQRKDNPVRLICSCGDGGLAQETGGLGHGLFTKALLEQMEESIRSGAAFRMDGGLETSLARRMDELAQENGLRGLQRPWAEGDVAEFKLWDGKHRGGNKIPNPSGRDRVTDPEPLKQVEPVRCPKCGKNNLVTETFQCGRCGRDNLCLRHRSKQLEGTCVECAEGEARKPTVDKVNFPDEDRLRMLAVQGYPDAQHELGCAYRDGVALEKDSAEAVKWLQKAAAQGHAGAKAALAGLQAVDPACGKPKPQQEGVPTVTGDEIFQGVLQAANEGDAKAMNALGCYYYHGVGVAKNRGTAFHWFHAGAGAGFEDAIHNLAVCYNNGDGVGRDLRKARELYELIGYDHKNPADHTQPWVSPKKVHFDKIKEPVALYVIVTSCFLCLMGYGWFAGLVEPGQTLRRSAFALGFLFMFISSTRQLHSKGMRISNVGGDNGGAFGWFWYLLAVGCPVSVFYNLGELSLFERPLPDWFAALPGITYFLLPEHISRVADHLFFARLYALMYAVHCAGIIVVFPLTFLCAKVHSEGRHSIKPV